MPTAEKITVPSVARMIRDIVAPEGFEKTVRTEPKTNWGPAFKVLVLKSADIEIEIHFLGGRESYSLASGHVTFETSAGKRSYDRYGVEDSFYIDNPLKMAGGRNMWTGDRVAKGKDRGTVTKAAGWTGFGEDRTYSEAFSIRWDGEEDETHYTNEALLKRLGIVKADVIEQTNAKIWDIVHVRIPEDRARIGNSESVPGIPFMVTPERKALITQQLKAGGDYSFTPSGFGTGYRLSANRGPWSRQADPKTAEFFGMSKLYVDTFDCD